MFFMALIIFDRRTAQKDKTQEIEVAPLANHTTTTLSGISICAVLEYNLNKYTYFRVLHESLKVARGCLSPRVKPDESQRELMRIAL